MIFRFRHAGEISGKVFAIPESKCVNFWRMEDDSFDLPEVWDEYQWERFLQQQDRNTERYFELMEKFMDHPDRDRIVAEEMGWSYHGGESEEFQELDEMMARELAEEVDMEDLPLGDEFSDSPLYRDVVEINRWLDDCSANHPEISGNETFLEMFTSITVCGAKVAAALSQEEDEDVELGMVIAYLKRGLKAINDALENLMLLRQGKALSGKELGELTELLFGARNQIVDLMKEYRSEWLRLYGGGG